MTSKEIRQQFKDFFASKQHHIVASAPMVIKDDPTLMFTNAGMNQFKDLFLGHQEPRHPRIANSQKCLRVSGKHNDLEEVGIDTYHHTMFEMLGNWSFGNYFKKEAIDWAWEFLTDKMRLAPDRLYATVFEGSQEDKIERDIEAADAWTRYLSPDRILNGNKKDNFWEMGDTGPCGPCSEIHVDLRDEEERIVVPAQQLINTGHPQVIEIWNLVFIQFNRKADGTLQLLPNKHVDTGMGFERLCMAIQKKKSNYDTDIFQPLIRQIEALSGVSYGKNEQSDIAMRVIADHIRAVSFSIADGQLPSNTGAGYVIRRILRRAIRYYYTFLNQKEPFINALVPVLVEQMGDAYPELKLQQSLIAKVILEEESSFLKTLQTGIDRLGQLAKQALSAGETMVSGKAAFELYDTYGFPPDLTQLILSEQKLTFEQSGFEEEMNRQKNRSRQAAEQITDDWMIVSNHESAGFNGYDHLTMEVRITRYRKVIAQKKTFYQLVFDQTPFYAESGGQVSDAGMLFNNDIAIPIVDVRKENNLIVHITEKLPDNPAALFTASVNEHDRQNTMRNHTATHLLHYALRKVLGPHVEQKGSLVHPDYLRFDFSHYQKMEESELIKVEQMVNAMIRENRQLTELRQVPIEEAKKMNAMALFGEKYGDQVRVIRFGDSVELCGGTHVSATGEIGYFSIVAESSIAAGIRRIEAITGLGAENKIRNNTQIIKEIGEALNHPADLLMGVKSLKEENTTLRKMVEDFQKEQTKALKANLLHQAEEVSGVTLICKKIELDQADQIRDLAFQIRGEIDPVVVILGAMVNGKPNLTIMISDQLVASNNLNAGQIVRESAKEIQGGGGGQPFYATAGGKDASGMDRAISKARSLVTDKL